MEYFARNGAHKGKNILAESRQGEDDGNISSGSPWLPKGFEFLSGLPEAKRRRRNVVVLQAWVDESGGKGQSSVFVFSALLASAEDWAGFSTSWQAVLDKPKAIKYFKMHEASKCNEQFGRFTESERDEKIRKLLVPMKGLLEVFCIADMAAFAETLAKYSVRPLRDPYFQQFHILIMAIALTLIDLGVKEPFEIFFDEHKIFGPKAKAWYPIVRDLCDDDMRAVMPVEPQFRTDTENPPLQAADMLAWVRRAWNDNPAGIAEFSWLLKELENTLFLSECSQYLDADRLQSIVKRSFTPEFEERARRVVAEYRRVYGPKWIPPFTHGINKKMKTKRDNSEYKKFDAAMGTILKADPKAVKEAMEAEKREHELSGKKRGPKPKKSSASGPASDAKD